MHRLLPLMRTRGAHVLALAVALSSACSDGAHSTDDSRAEETPAPHDASKPRDAGASDRGRERLDAGQPGRERALDGASTDPLPLPTRDAGLSSPRRSDDAGMGARSDATVDAAPPPSRGDDSIGACPSELLGFASIEGQGVQRCTGGGAAQPVRPSTAAELMAYASDDQPRVIEIAGTFSVPRLSIASNKTLVGIGKQATLQGGVRIRGKADALVRNVILQNLRIDGATSDVDGDAVQLYFARHVWIDHCEIWDGPDGNLDLTHGTSWVTVSWTKIHYTANYRAPEGETSDHRFASLVGHSDNNASEDTDYLKVSFHHNWWGQGVLERMPRVRFGQVHVFNNYFATPDNRYCVRAGRGASLLVEQNHFEGVNNPHEFNSPEDEATAHITARDNSYVGTSGLQATGGGGTPLASVPYQARFDPPASLPTLITTCAGPR
jgi:pectate lyase